MRCAVKILEPADEEAEAPDEADEAEEAPEEADEDEEEEAPDELRES